MGLSLNLVDSNVPVRVNILPTATCFEDIIIAAVYDMEERDIFHPSFTYNHSAVTLAYLIDTVAFESEYGFPFPEIRGVDEVVTPDEDGYIIAVFMILSSTACSSAGDSGSDNIIDLTPSKILSEDESLTTSSQDEIKIPTEPFVPTYPLDPSLEFWSDYSVEYSDDFHSIDNKLIYEVGSDKFKDWLREFNALNDLPMDDGYRDRNECNIVTFIREFQISKYDLIRIMGEYNYFSEAQIDALYSDDIYVINEAFANSNAMYYDGKIYTLKWLSKHSAEDYSNEGLPLEEVKAYLERVESVFASTKNPDNERNVSFVQASENAAEYEQLTQGDSLE